jgi:phospholipase/carboxylesterase
LVAMATNPRVARHRLAGRPLERAAPAGVLVHGRDQDAGVMLHLVERLDRPEAGYLLPEAAERSWYPGRYDHPLECNEPELTDALDAIGAAVDAAAARSPSGDAVLVGFSQGACLVAELLARRGAVNVAAAAILTGALIGEHGADRPVARLDGLPVAIVSSALDDWIPPGPIEDTARALREAGAEVMLQITQDPEHHIDDVAVAAVRALLDRAAAREEQR